MSEIFMKLISSRVTDGDFLERMSMLHKNPDAYLEWDEGCQGEELIGEHEEDHLAGDQQHHPEQKELLPWKLGVEPFCQNLNVSCDNLSHLGLHLLGEPLVNNWDLEGVELGRRPQSVGAGLRFWGHIVTCQVSLDKLSQNHFIVTCILALVELVHCPPSGRGSHITQLGDVNALAVSPQLIGSSRGARAVQYRVQDTLTHCVQDSQGWGAQTEPKCPSSALVSSHQAPGPGSTPPCQPNVKWQ